MLDSMELQDLSAAWDMAWQTRFCPPEVDLAQMAGAGHAQEHRQACPACRQNQAWREQACCPPAGRQASGPGPQAQAGEPAPGQLWILDPALAGWGPKQRYFNPPVVLVLQVGRHLQNSVLVAQTYHDRLLGGDDDLALAPERFTEPWNIYTLHRDFFWRPCGDFGAQAAQRVLAASRVPHPELPPWSLLQLFRQMEIELGCYFASQAVGRLLEEHRWMAEGLGHIAPADRAAALPDLQPPLAPALEQPQGTALVYRELQRLGLELPAGQAWTTAADLYFQATPRPEEMPLAAAGVEDDGVVPVVALNLRKGVPAAWQLLEARVTDFVGAPQVIVGGKIATMAAGEGDWQAQFAWMDDDGQSVACLASFFEMRAKGVAAFWAAFPLRAQRSSLAENRLRIRLFSKTGH